MAKELPKNAIKFYKAHSKRLEMLQVKLDFDGVIKGAISKPTILLPLF